MDSLVHVVQDFSVTFRGSSKHAILPDLSIHFSAICNSHCADVGDELFVTVLALKRVNCVFVLNLHVLILIFDVVTVSDVSNFFLALNSGVVISCYLTLTARIIDVLRITITGGRVALSVAHLDFNAGDAFCYAAINLVTSGY